ncbi:hypothetical protein DKX38_011914 [Salix brachista]|uniref:Uncharacterized protein n=1 Tax=Salix brachista TaxID=2182728 RepID=A0A5N5M0T0_9ROSI|nr:hypothetical protein DKX38_011914 [Salix brachista]
MSNGPYLGRPTRIEAVSALMWGGFVGEKKESKKVYKVAAHNVDLRKRLDPPLPQHCIGNIIHTAMVKWPTKVVDYNGLGGKIHESISLINNDYIRQVYADNTDQGLLLQTIREIDGEGIEAWVTLSEEAMLRFEKNSNILAYASVSPRI